MRKVFVILLVFISSNIANSLESYTTVNIEMIMFTNPAYNQSGSTKELFAKHIGELNRSKVLESLDLNNPLQALTNEYNKLQKNQNYKIILHASKQYNLLPSNKNKKFLVKTDDLTATLSISQNPTRNNYFTITLDSIYANNRLTKTIKAKTKEIYYFDHPIFGALVTIY